MKGKTLLKWQKPNGLILALNLGSSSLKFNLVRFGSLEKEYVGSITGIGEDQGTLEISSKENRQLIKKTFLYPALDTAIKMLMEWISSQINKSEILAIGYRLVQGGPLHVSPEKITEKLLIDLSLYRYLAPNHLPNELKLLDTFGKAYIGIPHIACFDTFFHKDMPNRSKFYPLPENYRENGLIRYGFHGLSYESVFRQLLREDTTVRKQKVIIAHLGNGSSLAAIATGIGKDTTMGISPMGGLVMATRSGDLDPGAILFILKQDQLSVEQLDDLLSKKSGLKAMAGTGNMEEIIEQSKHGQKARDAFELFCYQVKKYIGSFAAALGGLDLLVFCGGIGENSALVRQEICNSMDFMGLKLDHLSNIKGRSLISHPNSRVTIRVMKTDEELMIAAHTQRILNAK
jgi:acetate kinase